MQGKSSTFHFLSAFYPNYAPMENMGEVCSVSVLHKQIMLFCCLCWFPMPSETEFQQLLFSCKSVHKISLQKELKEIKFPNTIRSYLK